ncbi:hypothetical protein A2U01_0075411, partial [Trifolium medium]|nr:hypothetical protein [Trifolium medium]
GSIVLIEEVVHRQKMMSLNPVDSRALLTGLSLANLCSCHRINAC